MKRLSKSRFVTGKQCHRRLWWQLHDRDAPELVVDAATQAIFDQGHRVGAAARRFAGDGVLVELDPSNPQAAIAATGALVASDVRRMFEACFSEGGVFVAVDILERIGDGPTEEFAVVEVKSTTRVKDTHLWDLAIQVFVLRAAGLDVSRMEVMHLNRDHRHPSTEPLFVREDVTRVVEALLLEVPDEVTAQLDMLRGNVPNVEPGERCHKPYPCPFTGRCLPRPARNDVSELHRISTKRVEELRGQAETLDALPADVKLTEIQSRQVRAARTNRIVVEGELSETLASIAGPIPRSVAYLDFETVSPALPAWTGTRPYDSVPVQFSVHLTGPDGRMVHRAHLASGADDPRPTLAAALVRALRDAGCIVAWNSAFEAKCLRHLAAAVPSHAEALLAAAERLVDLLPVVRRHVYHPRFRGSFSLKSVLPALAPTMAYTGLPIGDGLVATTLLETMLLRPEELTADPVELREQLLEYCRHDTRALVTVHEELARLAGRTAA